MEIVENLEQWKTDFRDGWLAHYKATGESSPDLYVRPRNRHAPGGKGVDLSQSRLLLVTSSGAYLKQTQLPFDAEDQNGDYSIRTFPFSTPLSDLAFAHTHYDHAAVDSDPEVVVPLRLLSDLVDEGRIGEMAPSVISFGGYLRDISRVIDEVIPPMLEVARKEQVHAALLVPAWPVCIQSVGLIARAMEMAGIATTMTGFISGRVRLVNPPRATTTELKAGATLGFPGDKAQQRRIVTATLELLARDAPLPPVKLDEQWSEP